MYKRKKDKKFKKKSLMHNSDKNKNKWLNPKNLIKLTSLLK